MLNAFLSNHAIDLHLSDKFRSNMIEYKNLSFAISFYNELVVVLIGHKDTLV